MKNHVRSLFLILGILCFLSGSILMILGLIWGLFVLLAGFAFIVVHSALMLRTGGYDPMEALFNGWGKGRQTSMADKLDYQPDNPNATIWDQMEKK